MLPRTPREEKEAQQYEVARAQLAAFKQTSPAERSVESCYRVLQSKIGFQLFLEDPGLRAALTTRELNEVTALGKNILQLIATKSEGRRLIAEEHAFRGKITEAGFCHGKRASAAYHFIMCQTGIEILSECYDLFQMIPADLLNELPEDYGPPLAYHLSRTVVGVKLLVRLFQVGKIKNETINLNITSQTILCNMMKFPEGISALAVPEFRRCIRVEALNLVSDRVNTSVLDLICMSGPEYIAD